MSGGLLGTCALPWTMFAKWKETNSRMLISKRCKPRVADWVKPQEHLEIENGLLIILSRKRKF